MGAPLGITIAVCTWNRSKSLNVTLKSLQQLTVPSGIEWELVVINNNCTDDTDEVVAQFADDVPIRLLHEKRQGLSNARNCAVDAAKGEYIVWTDDDVIIDPNWLVAYVNAIRTWPNASLFGGPIHLKLEGHSPSWVSEMLCDVELAGVYAQRDLSSLPIGLGQEDIRKNPKSEFAGCLEVPRLLLSAVKWELRFQASRLRKRPKIWLQDLRTASICWGRLIEFWRRLSNPDRGLQNGKKDAGDLAGRI
jgi:glycosyltransferase involved in cell wall biosynthesis